MLDYTRGVFSKTIEDLKRLTFFFGLSLQIFQIGYLIYALCVGAGILVANIILLAISALYLGFVLYMHRFHVAKETTKVLKSIYRWSKRLIKLFTLAVSIYGLYATISNPVTVKSLISIVFLMFMTIAWIFDVLFSILIVVVEQRKELFFNAIKMDLEPVLKAKNFIDKIRGREVDSEIVADEDRGKLEKIKSVFKQKKKEKKEEKKEERRAARAAKKAAKKAEQED
jgi:hypothetical protein